MIEFALLLQVAATSPASDEIAIYRDCVAKAALKYEVVRADPGTTADAAVGSCADLKRAAIKRMVDSQTAASPITRKDFRDLVETIWTATAEYARERALVSIFEKRVRNAQN